MMEKKIYRQLTTDARQALGEGRLHDVFVISRSLIKDCAEVGLQRNLESLENDYHAMLDFIASGGQDQHQEDVHLHLRQRTSMLLTELERAAFLQPFSHPLLDDLYTDNGQPTRSLEQAFYDGLYKPVGEKNEEDSLLLRLKTCSAEESDMLFAGMALSVWCVFDIRKIELLIENATTEPRALLGVILSVLNYTHDLRLFPETYHALRLLMGQESLREMIVHINHELLLCSQSERIERHIKDELIPTMMEAVQDDSLRLDFTLDDEQEQDSFEQLMARQNAPSLTPLQERKKKEFMDKMKEFVEIQQEGVDINSEIMDSCSRMPFFQEMVNWFMPFSPHHPVIEPIAYPNGNPHILLHPMYDLTYMCDIDKYAMTLILGKRLSHSKLHKVMDKMKQVIAESEAVPDMDFKLPILNEKQLISNLIRAMYRFFNKSMWKDEFSNPFHANLDFSNQYMFGHIYVNHPTLALEMADSMWKMGDQKHALSFYLTAGTAIDGIPSASYLRIASIYDQMGDMKSCLENLRLAEAAAPNDATVLHAMTDYYKKIHNAEKQYQYLARLEEQYPENGKILTEMGNFLVSQERFQEASQRFYKMEYLEKRILTAQRGIAWCALHQEKYDTAIRYYRKIFNTPGAANWSDYLNGGHTAWLMNDMTSALAFYHQYIKRYLTDDPKITDALEPFDNDRALLRDLGKSATDVALMHDIIALKAI